MLNTFKPSIVLLGLTVFLFGPACEASSLGLTVHVVPQDSDGGKTVWAYFSAIAPNPCPSLSELCADGENCVVNPTSLPFSGTKPEPGWCVRQWQKIVPSNYNASISLGSNNTKMYVSLKAGPVVRANGRKLNQPPYVGLFPPLRARVNCSHDFRLSVKDLDGDKVRCRLAQPEQGECIDCTPYPFIQLHKEECILTFTGEAPAGQYFIYLMVEDLIPSRQISLTTDSPPLSSIPAHLSLTVEESTTSCSDEPIVTGGTPKKDTMLLALPYQQVKFNVNFMSQLESVLEVAVVGPPELYRVGFQLVGPLAMMTMSWVRSGNKLARLLPICFAANTNSLQSEPRCVWLFQREMKALPAGTELRCDKMEMTLVLPLTSLRNINLNELQPNSSTCPITYNSTHLTAHISLDGCGTKTVHSGSELVYTNTLRTVHPYSVISRQPSFVLPLACRFPGIQAKGPQDKVIMPTEREVFGFFGLWIEFHFPEEGPQANFATGTTRSPPGRKRRDAPSGSSSFINRTIGSRIDQLDLYVFSNCSVAQAELIVTKCFASETDNFTQSQPIVQQGCVNSNNAINIITAENNLKVYRINLDALRYSGSEMYVQCTVNLCIATSPTQKCPDLCSTRSIGSVLINSVFSRTYTITSGAVSLVVLPPDPDTTTPTTTTAIGAHAPTPATTLDHHMPVPATPATAAPHAAAPGAAAPDGATTAAPDAATTAASINIAAAQNSTTAHAPEQASAMAAGVILTTVSIFLQSIFLY